MFSQVYQPAADTYKTFDKDYGKKLSDGAMSRGTGFMSFIDNGTVARTDIVAPVLSPHTLPHSRVSSTVHLLTVSFAPADNSIEGAAAMV